MLRLKEEYELLDDEKEEYMELAQKLKNGGPIFLCGEGVLSLEALQSILQAMELGLA